MRIVKQTIEIVVKRESIFSTYRAIDECDNIQIEITKNFSNNLQGLEELFKWGEKKGEQFSTSIIFINNTKERIIIKYLNAIFYTLKRIVRNVLG